MGWDEKLNHMMSCMRWTWWTVLIIGISGTRKIERITDNFFLETSIESDSTNLFEGNEYEL